MKTYKAKDLLAERYGQKGSESREQFRESAYSYQIKDRKAKYSIAAIAGHVDSFTATAGVGFYHGRKELSPQI